MRRIAIALWSVVSVGSEAFASNADRDILLDQLQAKLSVCAAFYSFEQSCGAEGENGLRLKAARRSAEALAGAIAMSADTVALRLEIALAANQALTGGCDGLRTLESRYAVQCEPLSSVAE